MGAWLSAARHPRPGPATSERCRASGFKSSPHGQGGGHAASCSCRSEGIGATAAIGGRPRARGPGPPRRRWRCAGGGLFFQPFTPRGYPPAGSFALDQIGFFSSRSCRQHQSFPCCERNARLGSRGWGYGFRYGICACFYRLCNIRLFCFYCFCRRLRRFHICDGCSPNRYCKQGRSRFRYPFDRKDFDSKNAAGGHGEG